MESDQLRVPRSQARELLESGIIIREKQSFVVVPEMVLKDDILFRVQPLETIIGRDSLRAWIQALRLFSLTATFAPFLVVLSYGLALGWKANVPIGIAALVSVMGLQICINLLNDYEDHVRLIDLPGTFGGAGIIQRGQISARQVKRMAYAALVLSTICAIPCFISSPEVALGIGLFGLLGVIGYSSYPLGLKYRGLGDLAVLVLCGPALVLGLSWMLFEKMDVGLLLLGLGIGSAATLILHANNIADIVADTRAGARTFASILGFRGAQVYMVLLILAAYLGLFFGFWFNNAGFWILPAFLLSLPLAIKVLRLTFQASGPESPIIRHLRVMAAKFHLVLAFSFVVAILIQNWRPS